MPFTPAKLYESPFRMSRKSVIEKKLDSLADYLGVEFDVGDDQSICVKDTDYRGKLSKTDVEKIVETLWDDKRFRTEFEERINLLEQYLKAKLSKKIDFTVEDQSKFWAISEILKANYREKLNKVEEE